MNEPTHELRECLPLRFQVVCYAALLWQSMTDTDVYATSSTVGAGAEGSAQSRGGTINSELKGQK